MRCGATIELGQGAERDKDRDRMRRQVLPACAMGGAASEAEGPPLSPPAHHPNRSPASPTPPATYRPPASRAAERAAARHAFTTRPYGMPAREEVRGVHMPALRLGARVRDQHPCLLEVRLPAEQRSHHRRDARQLR